MAKWVAWARYADGTEIEKAFPYRENGSYSRECEREYQLECWLIEEHEGCVEYSVNFVDDED